jgi:hypothetical protein
MDFSSSDIDFSSKGILLSETAVTQCRSDNHVKRVGRLGASASGSRLGCRRSFDIDFPSNDIDLASKQNKLIVSPIKSFWDDRFGRGRRRSIEVLVVSIVTDTFQAVGSTRALCET